MLFNLKIIVVGLCALVPDGDDYWILVMNQTQSQKVCEGTSEEHQIPVHKAYITANQHHVYNLRELKKKLGVTPFPDTYGNVAVPIEITSNGNSARDFGLDLDEGEEPDTKINYKKFFKKPFRRIVPMVEIDSSCHALPTLVAEGPPTSKKILARMKILTGKIHSGRPARDQDGNRLAVQFQNITGTARQVVHEMSSVANQAEFMIKNLDGDSEHRIYIDGFPDMISLALKPRWNGDTIEIVISNHPIMPDYSIARGFHFARYFDLCGKKNCVIPQAEGTQSGGDGLCPTVRLPPPQ